MKRHQSIDLRFGQSQGMTGRVELACLNVTNANEHDVIASCLLSSRCQSLLPHSTLFPEHLGHSVRGDFKAMGAGSHTALQVLGSLTAICGARCIQQRLRLRYPHTVASHQKSRVVIYVSRLYVEIEGQITQMDPVK